MPPFIRETVRAADGLIFDLDGTLWDSTETVARAWTHTLRRMGDGRRIISPEEIAAVMGMAHRDLYRAMFPGIAEREQETLVLACYAEEELHLHKEGGRLYPGVADGLKTLSSSHRLHIVSNCQQGYIEAFLDWSELGNLLTDHECHGNTGASKAENLRSVAGRNGLSHPLYVGDTEGDRLAAAEAGMPFIHARYGFGKPAEACAGIDAFSELLPAPGSDQQTAGG